MKGDEERIREGGCEAYLSKPISVAKFIATVRTYLDADGKTVVTSAESDGRSHGRGGGKPAHLFETTWL